MKYAVRQPLTEIERAPLNAFSTLLAQLLFYRGIKDTETAEKFLAPDYDRDGLDPFLLKDAEKAATRIIQAIKSNDDGKKGEKIAIYSDYDADGIPAAAMFHDFFARINFKNFIIYIPHRHNEGFGVNDDAVKELAEKGVTLMITIDCGITDVKPIALAKKLGIDVIVTDHHEPPEKLPPAYAIIDHKQIDCVYPDKNLCGSAVGYKLIQAILKKDRLGLPDGHEKWLLDLVGIATLSDMVPLIGENRVFAHYGLAVLRKSQRLGFKKLLAKLKMSQLHLTEDDIAFMITPRINAASRMGLPMDAFDLLTAQNDEDASRAADHLDHINNERKGIVASLVKEVKKTIHERYSDSIPSVIVLGNPEWRPSLLGLAANSCAEEFDRPVFLWGRDGDNIIKGSCRSEGRTSVVELMRAVPETVFIQYGGHKHSGGFAVSNEEIHFLEKKLVEGMDKLQKSESTDPRMAEMIDAEITLDELNWDLQRELNRLAPFGMDNRKPLFIFKNIKPSALRIFGKGKEHIELVLKKSNGSSVSAISFFGAENDWAKNLTESHEKNIDLVASIEKSMFKGRPELRLRVVDVILK